MGEMDGGEEDGREIGGGVIIVGLAFCFELILDRRERGEEGTKTQIRGFVLYYVSHLSVQSSS